MIEILKPRKVKVGDNKYSNQCKRVTIKSIEMQTADEDTLVLMSNQIVPSDMQDSGQAGSLFMTMSST